MLRQTLLGLALTNILVAVVTGYFLSQREWFSGPRVVAKRFEVATTLLSHPGEQSTSILTEQVHASQALAIIWAKAAEQITSMILAVALVNAALLIILWFAQESWTTKPGKAAGRNKGLFLAPRLIIFL